MKSLVIILSALLSLSAFGQGTVNFASNGPQIYDLYGPGSPPVPAPVGSFTVGLYYGVTGTIDPSTLSLLATTRIGPVAGWFLGGTVTTPSTTAGGAAAVFEIRVWSGAFASYEAALGSGDVSVLFARSGLFNVITGSPQSVPPGPPANLVFPNFGPVWIPEPSPVVVGLLGAAALMFHNRFRVRRKLNLPGTP